MAEQPSSPPGAGYVTTEFPVAGLTRVVRHITGHNAEGKSVFLSTDCGDHHRVMGEKQAISSIIYSTHETPVELNDDADIKYAKDNEVGVTSPRLLVNPAYVFLHLHHRLRPTDVVVVFLFSIYSPVSTSTMAPWRA